MKPLNVRQLFALLMLGVLTVGCQQPIPPQTSPSPAASVVPLDQKFLNEARAAAEKKDHKTAAVRAELAVDILKQQNADPAKLEPALLITAQSYAASGEHEKAVEYYQALVKAHPDKKQYKDEKARSEKTIAAAERAKRIASAKSQLAEATKQHKNGEFLRAEETLLEILPTIKGSGDPAAVEKAIALKKALDRDLAATRKQQAADARVYLAQGTKAVNGTTSGGKRGPKPRLNYEVVSHSDLIRERLKRDARRRKRLRNPAQAEKLDLLPADYLDQARAGNIPLKELKSVVKRAKEWRKDQWIVRY